MHGQGQPHAGHHGRRGLRDPVRARRRECTGNFFIDEVLLRDAGVTDFEQYAVDPAHDLFRDFFVPDSIAEGLPTKTLAYGLG
jgi:hypothetical protein